MENSLLSRLNMQVKIIIINIEFPSSFSFLFFFMNQLTVSPQLEAKALNILNAKNPLDLTDFSPVDYFNKLFPNGTLFQTKNA